MPSRIMVTVGSKTQASTETLNPKAKPKTEQCVHFSNEGVCFFAYYFYTMYCSFAAQLHGCGSTGFRGLGLGQLALNPKPQTGQHMAATPPLPQKLTFI